MKADRRALLQGLTGAALLTPALALGKATAARAASSAPAHSAPVHADSANPAPAEQQAMADQHMESMTRVLGPGLWGQEQIAMLVYPGFTALDLVGPHYFFACLFGATVHLVTTEADLSPVASDLGLAIAPTVSMADAPRDCDVLFVPGGTDGTRAVMTRADTMAWIRDRAARARWITSVCTGSMVLGAAGLLRGRKATSHWATHGVLADFGAIPVDSRIVADGNILTAAGVSAGLDFALALVERLRGRPYAQGLMLQAEYRPDPPFAGGTLATTPDAVGTMMADMFRPVAERFRALADAGDDGV